MLVIGLSLGYLNRPDLTADKFINNPFGNGLVYKTGDLTSWLPDGSINYIGRIDNQIKLRGFRIELSEIDSKILEFTGVKESVTIMQNTTLCSYIVTESIFDLNALKQYLREILPAFMVPSFITKLDSLPVNVNGKVDKKALPRHLLDTEVRKIIPPRNELDKTIINELKTILQIDNISIKDSFFSIGGDSLNAITLSTHLSNTLNVLVTVKDIFDNPIIENLSDKINNCNSNYTANIISKAEISTSYVLSYAQKRIYYASIASGKDSITYNVCGGFLFDTTLDTNKVQSALNELVRIHPSFRTIFTYDSGELVQSVLDNVSITLETEHTSANPQELVDNFPKPFDLSKAPLLRAKLCILDNSKSLLMLDSHHIILDGTSFTVVFRDFCKAYNGEDLSSPELDYTDYAVWEKEFLSSPEFENINTFWVNKFKDKEFTPLNLPYDYPLSNIKSFKRRKCVLFSF